MWKPLLAFALIAGLATPVAGQSFAIDQGSMVLDGSISFTNSGGDLYENANGDRSTEILLLPSLLYFVSPGLALGGELVVQRVSQGDFSATTLGVGPEVAYFFGDAESTVYPFVNASMSYVNTSSSGNGIDASGVGFDAGGGAAFMLTGTVAITGQVAYTFQNLSIDQTDESRSGNMFRIELGVAAFLF